MAKIPVTATGTRIIEVEEAPEQEVEIDLTVPHGSIAARYRGSVSGAASVSDMARLMRIADQLKLDEISDAKSAETAPEEGKLAPGFRGISFDGKMVDLSALRGRKVWLIFYRYATCPLCNMHLAAVASRYPLLKKAGLEVIGVFESAVPQFFQPGGSASAGIPLISDTRKQLYSLYRTRKSLLGLLRPSVAVALGAALSKGFKQGKIEGELGQLPSHFLIDPAGVIRKVHHGKTVVDHIPWSAVGLFTGLRASELKPPQRWIG